MLVPWDRMPACVVRGRCIPWWMGGDLDRKGLIDQHKQFLHQLNLEMTAFEPDDALAELARVELKRLRAAPDVNPLLIQATPRMGPIPEEDEKEEALTTIILSELRALVREKDDLAVGRKTRMALRRQEAIDLRLQELSMNLKDDVLWNPLPAWGCAAGWRPRRRRSRPGQSMLP